MGQVRFPLVWPGSRTIRYEFLEVFDDFGKDFLGHSGGNLLHPGQDSRQDTTYDIEGHRPIYAPLRIAGQLFLGSQVGGQGVEIVTHHLGPSILAGGQPSQTGRVLQIEPVFDALERLLNPPTAVIKAREGSGRIARGIKQERHQHPHLAGRRHLTNQANRRRQTRTLVIDGILTMRWRQCHLRLIFSGSHELGDGGKGSGRITAHAKGDASMQQRRDQPGSRTAPIEHQHVLVTEPVKPLKQHLAFANQRTVQDQRVKQLDPWPKQTEDHRLPNMAAPFRIKQGQANLRCVRRQDPQTLPVRLLRNDLIDQAQQLCIERLKEIGDQMATRLGEGAGRDRPTQAGSSGKQRKEGIKLSLNCAANTGEQESDQIGEWQLAVSGEKPGLASGGGKKIGTMNVVCQPRNDIGIFRPSYKAYLYQLVTSYIISRRGLMAKLTELDDKLLSQED